MEKTFDKSNARILGANLHGTTICAAAARISTTNGSATSLFEKSINNPNNEKLIKNVLLSGHQSIMEHCFFNISFTNVSAFVEQYLIEFRLASFTVQSRRYVDFSQVGFFRDQSLPKKIAELYDRHMGSLFDTYEKLLELGIPKEDARFVLPYCFHSNFYCSCNARELLHIICTMLYGRGSVIGELYTLGTNLAKDFEAYFPGEIERNRSKYSVEKSLISRQLSAMENAQVNSSNTVTANIQPLSHSTISSEDLFACAKHNFSTGQSLSTNANENLLYHSRARELELINICFKIQNISLSAITHLVRHRMQSVLVPFIGEAVYKNTHITPETVFSNPAAKTLYEDAFVSNAKMFKQLRSQGLAPVNCIYFALSGNTLDVISSMNGRELFHFIQLRTCNRAQWEIRKIAEYMLKISRSIYPLVFSKLGPSCYITGVCPEGKKSCGHISDVKKYYSNF